MQQVKSDKYQRMTKIHVATKTMTILTRKCVIGQYTLNEMS